MNQPIGVGSPMPKCQSPRVSVAASNQGELTIPASQCQVGAKEGMSLHQSGVELKGFPEVLLGEPSPMPPQLDLPGHETGLSGHWVSVGNSHQSRHGFLGAAVGDVELG